MGVTRVFSLHRLSALPLAIAVCAAAVGVPCSADPKESGTYLLLQTSTTPVNKTIPSVTADPQNAKPGSGSTATSGSKKFDKPYGSHLEPILQRIGANPDLRKKITIIVQTYRPKIEPLRTEYKTKSAEFINYIVQGKPAEVIMARQGELNNLYGVIITEYGLMRMEIRRVLTPQQCKAFEEYRAQQGWHSK